MVGVESDPRVAGFREAVKAACGASPGVLAYSDLAPDASGRSPWPAATLLRLESPGWCLPTVRRFMIEGQQAAEEAGYAVCSRRELEAAALDRGEFIAPHQFHYGFSGRLQALAEALMRQPVRASMQHIPDILLCYDKAACHRYLETAGIPVPGALPDIRSYEALREAMRARRCPRVFVKSRFGSGGSGVVALSADGRERVCAWTALVSREARYFDRIKVAPWREAGEIAGLIDRLCGWGVHVERWFPKAMVDRRSADLRLLTVAGEPAFCVLRSSRSPITNLHLSNRRADCSAFSAAVGESAWRALLETARRTAALFPRSFYLGLDMAVDVARRRHVVLEVNAFGDFLRGVEREGCNPYAWQLRKFPAWAGLAAA